MASNVRLRLDARPRFLKCVEDIAFVDFGLRRTQTDLITDGTFYTVIGHKIAGTERIGIIGERSGGDATIWTAAISAETYDRIEHN